MLQIFFHYLFWVMNLEQNFCSFDWIALEFKVIIGVLKLFGIFNKLKSQFLELIKFYRCALDWFLVVKSIPSPKKRSISWRRLLIELNYLNLTLPSVRILFYPFGINLIILNYNSDNLHKSVNFNKIDIQSWLRSYFINNYFMKIILTLVVFSRNGLEINEKASYLLMLNSFVKF